MRQIYILVLILLIAVCAIAQTATKPQVQVVPAPYTPADSGKAMFDACCGACHGVDAKGHGPAAAAMKSAVTDLTISQRHTVELIRRPAWPRHCAL
jgi:mono/diheme cytochrome c family protein